MRKIKKAIFNPVKFIQDSWIFKSNHLETIKNTKNLFVISHLGQLAQVEALIKDEKFLNCILVILYTNKNKNMPKMVARNVNKNLFNNVFLLLLPNFPNQIRIKKLFLIRNSYKNMLSQIKPHRLFILSFEKHYALLADIARKRKIEINFVEEGTATYKYNDYNEAITSINNSFTKEDKRSGFWIKNTPFFRDIMPALSMHRDMDKIYALYPDMLDDIFRIKEKREFFLYKNIDVTNQVIETQVLYGIDENSILFLNQRYPFPDEIYASCLISILKSYKEKYNLKVFIKLHPKDSESLKVMLKDTINSLNLQNSIVLIDKYGFLVESLIAISQPKIILALTSTSLVYSPKISPSSSVVSIYPIMRLFLLEHMEYNKKNFFEIEEHFEILKKFQNIDFVENIDNI